VNCAARTLLAISSGSTRNDVTRDLWNARTAAARWRRPASPGTGKRASAAAAAAAALGRWAVEEEEEEDEVACELKLRVIRDKRPEQIGSWIRTEYKCDSLAKLFIRLKVDGATLLELPLGAAAASEGGEGGLLADGLAGLPAADRPALHALARDLAHLKRVAGEALGYSHDKPGIAGQENESVGGGALVSTSSSDNEDDDGEWGQSAFDVQSPHCTKNEEYGVDVAQQDSS